MRIPNTRYEKEINAKIKELEITLQIELAKLEHTFEDDAWHERMNKVNNLRVDIKTQKTRYDNIGKTAYLPQFFSIPNQK